MLQLLLLLGCTAACPDLVCDTEDTCPEPDTDETDETGDTGPTAPTVADLDPYLAPTELWVEPMDPEPGATAEVHYCGPLAYRDDVSMHYGFDGWDGGGTDAVMSKDGFACQVASVTIPEGSRVMHMVFQSAEVWDDHGGLDYHWSLEFPYVGPFLTPTGPSELTVHWETSVPCLGVVEHGPTEELGHLAAGDELTRLHHVTIGALSAGSWFYRVHDSAGHASEVFEVGVVDPEAETLTLVAASDMQDKGDMCWGEIAPAILEVEPQGLLIPGDLAADDTPGYWWIFFDRGSELLARVPMAATTGNHDTPTGGPDGDTNSLRRWLGRASVHTTVQLGPAHIFLLGSDLMDDLQPGGTQYAFVEAELATSPSGWVLAAVHIPPYNAGTRHLHEQHSVRVLTELFDGEVDWVFTGHEHLAQRMKPLRYSGQVVEEYGRGEGQGVGYTVLPPAGNWNHHRVVSEESEEARYRDRLAYPEVRSGSDQVDSEQGFVTLELSATQMTLKTWGMGEAGAPVDPHVVDEVTVSR